MRAKRASLKHFVRVSDLDNGHAPEYGISQSGFYLFELHRSYYCLYHLVHSSPHHQSA